jgi:hypothetical protein
MMGECIGHFASEMAKPVAKASQPLPKTLWLFSFKTKMTYLKEWSILKMRAFRRSNTLQSETQKVERALTTIAQLMTG